MEWMSSAKRGPQDRVATNGSKRLAEWYCLFAVFIYFYRATVGVFFVRFFCIESDYVFFYLLNRTIEGNFGMRSS